MESNTEKNNKDTGISIKTNFLTLIPMYDPTDGYFGTEYEIEDSTFLLGTGMEVNYYFNDLFAAGIGVGLEKLTQPKFIYFPLYFNTLFLLGDEFFMEAKFGVHSGNVSNSGFIFRGGLGYTVNISNNFNFNLILSYSFQNIYKDFKNSNRPNNYYNIESVGFTLSFDLK